MLDREKVINSIKACAHHPDHDCQSCDYCDNLFCYNDQLIEDFETLMKEQEPVVRCRDCKHWTVGDFGPFCPYHYDARPDWFCADGERKEE